MKCSEDKAGISHMLICHVSVIFPMGKQVHRFVFLMFFFFLGCKKSTQIVFFFFCYRDSIKN